MSMIPTVNRNPSEKNGEMERPDAIGVKAPTADYAGPKLVIDLGDVRELLRQWFKRPLGGDPTPTEMEFVRRAVVELIAREAVMKPSAHLIEKNREMEPADAISAKAPVTDFAGPKLVIDLGDVRALLRERFKKPLGGDPSPIDKEFVRRAVIELMAREAAMKPSV